MDDTFGAAASNGLAGTTAYLFGRMTYEKLNAFPAHPAGPQPDGRVAQGGAPVRATRTLTGTD